MKSVTTVGIDLAKMIFQIHGADERGKAVLRKRLTRKELLPFIAHLQPCTIVSEACASAHYWAREFRAFGHEVKLIAAQHVKPFVQSQKNDRNDAEAIVEAASRPKMRYVAVKEVWQQDFQSLHRVRQQFVETRTRFVNQTRGLLLEYGVVIPEGLSQFQSQIHEVLSNEKLPLTETLRGLLRINVKYIQELSEELKGCERKLKELSEQREEIQKLQEIPGVGLLISTQFVSAIGNPRIFKNGRQAAAWLGLVPKQNSSGGKERLAGITKTGDSHLRALLIHGARAAILAAIRKQKKDPLSQWILRLHREKGWNKTAVALANRLCRMMWHVWSYKEDYSLKMAAA